MPSSLNSTKPDEIPPIPASAVTDYETALHMAHAAHPHYTRLVEGGRDLSINQAVKIGIEIGTAEEGARRDYLAQHAGAGAVAETTDKAVTGTPGEELLGYDSFGERRKSFEQNVEVMRSTVSLIFDTLRDTPLGKTVLNSKRRTEKGVDNTLEFMYLYDPVTGITTGIFQSVQNNSTGREIPFFCVADSFVPVGQKQTGRRAKGRMLVPGRRLSFHNNTITFEERLLDGGEEDSVQPVEDQDPAFVSGWTTRLVRSIPIPDRRLMIEGGEELESYTGEDGGKVTPPTANLTDVAEYAPGVNIVRNKDQIPNIYAIGVERTPDKALSKQLREWQSTYVKLSKEAFEGSAVAR